MSDESAPDGRYVIFFDDLVDTVTQTSVPYDKFGEEVCSEMFNSAPSEELKEKRGQSTHVVHTKMGYDIYFHIGVG